MGTEAGAGGPGTGDKLPPAPQLGSEPALAEWNPPFPKQRVEMSSSLNTPSAEPPFLWLPLFHSDTVCDCPGGPTGIVLVLALISRHF